MTREEAIKLIDDRMCFGRGKWSEHHMPEIDAYWEAGQMAIKALGEPHWIPCSERLPEDDTEVLVYLFSVPSPYIAWVSDCHWYTEEFEIEKEDYPIAWMPLPEPWKEGD